MKAAVTLTENEKRSLQADIKDLNAQLTAASEKLDGDLEMKGKEGKGSMETKKEEER